MNIIKKFEFQPDYNNLVKSANNIWVDRVPLYEHNIGGNAIKQATGYSPWELMGSNDEKDIKEGYRQYWEFFKVMGYDTASIEYCICSALINGGALGAHKEGCIKTREDFEKYPWDEIKVRFFEQNTKHLNILAQTCPEGMKAVGGVGNGVFECVQDLVGYMDLCYLKADDEELFADIFRKMGDVCFSIWDEFMEKYSDTFCVLRFGDDLGFNTTTLLSKEDIIEHIIPQYRRITDKVHSKNKPFLLHSCGNLFNVFDEIITMANINAKHSNEDSIAHFKVWVDKYGDRIGNFGGIDTDVLCRYDAKYIKEYIFDCLNHVKGHGGIAFSSGNSIPDYVPFEGYLAMIEAVREWRKDKQI